MPLGQDILTLACLPVTRSHKFNDKDHTVQAEGGGGATATEQHLPRFFAKHGHVGEDPKKTKKNGAGKANWGGPGEEVVDDDFNFVNARRRSNSSSFANGLKDFKTKFEVNDPEPVFEESVHGPEVAEVGDELARADTSSTGSSQDEEKSAKSV